MSRQFTSCGARQLTMPVRAQSFSNMNTPPNTRRTTRNNVYLNQTERTDALWLDTLNKLSSPSISRC